MRIQFISHPDFLLHDTGLHHPERAERLHAIRDQLILGRINDFLDVVDARPATEEQLELVHEKGYIDAIVALSPATGTQWIDQDTVMSPNTLRAALLAAGAVVQGVDEVLDGDHKRVFCCVRPPGHHAERDRAMGFCFFNNVAVGAAYAMDVRGLERVAVVDFDVHHGNGTEDIYSGDDRLMYFSSFQHPLFPHTGTGVTADNIINTPLPGGMTGDGFRMAVESSWLPRLEQLRPQLILISAGFDGHVEDDMSGLRLVEDDYSWITERLGEGADKYADGRIVSVLEGGYNLSALGRSVVAHLKALM